MVVHRHGLVVSHDNRYGLHVKVLRISSPSTASSYLVMRSVGEGLQRRAQFRLVPKIHQATCFADDVAFSASLMAQRAFPQSSVDIKIVPRYKPKKAKSRP